MESQLYGTPVLGADIGGIPELIRAGQTGELFESGNGEALRERIADLWSDEDRCDRYAANCATVRFANIAAYTETLMGYYTGTK